MRPAEIQTKADFMRYLIQAQHRTDEILAATAWGLATAIKRQLNLIEECVAASRRPTDAEIAQISIGVIAVRNLDETDPAYADALCELDYAFLKNWDNLR